MYSDSYAKRQTNTNKEDILNRIGTQNLKTINPLELQETEKNITMAELEYCLKKLKIISLPDPLDSLEPFIKPFGQH